MKSRADGLASWCKQCSNKTRKLHRKSERRPEYRVVASLVKQGVKPHACPVCEATNVPAYLMRGLVVYGVVTWQCQRCHLNSIKEKRQACRLTPQAAQALATPTKRVRRCAVDYCDWCCDQIAAGAGIEGDDTSGPFCGPNCHQACYAARRARSIEAWVQSFQSSSSSESSSESSESLVTRTLVGTPSSSSSSTSKSSTSVSVPSGAGMS